MMQNMQNNSHLISQIKHQQTGSVAVHGQGVDQLDMMQQPSRNAGMANVQPGQFKTEQRQRQAK